MRIFPVTLFGKKKGRFLLFFLMLVFLFAIMGTLTERVFHHSFEKFILGILQRIDYNPHDFDRRITIIDTSPLYDIDERRTDRLRLADLIHAVSLGNPKMTAIDILLDVDPRYQNPDADEALKNALDQIKHAVIPEGADPALRLKDHIYPANIRINDGYEIPISLEEILSMPFRMVSIFRIPYPEQDERLVVNYGATAQSLQGTEQLISASKLLKIYHNESLEEQEKENELGMLLASQWVFIGYCNPIFNIDQHDTPLGKQPGVIIWANAIQNLLWPDDRIDFNPWWIFAVWALLSSVSFLLLKHTYDRMNHYYTAFFWLMVCFHMAFWTFVCILCYFRTHVWIPLFTFIFVSSVAFPVYRQINRFLKMLKILIIRWKIQSLPQPFRTMYLDFVREDNPYKRLQISFTLIEDCVRFSVLLGLAQARTAGIELGRTFTKGLPKHMFARPAFGHWHGMMRNLAKNLQGEPEILEAWKSIYLKTDKRGRWVQNELFNGIDKDYQELFKPKEIENISDEDIKLKQYVSEKLLLKESQKRGWLKEQFARIQQIGKSLWMPLERHFNEKSSELDVILDDLQLKGKNANVIQIRNRMIHGHGAFMPDEECEKLANALQNYLKVFIFDKLQFWQKAIIEGQRESTYARVTEKQVQLYPFFVIDYCTVHRKNVLFLLTAIDFDKKVISYRGPEQSCKRKEEKTAELCREILGFLGY